MRRKRPLQSRGLRSRSTWSAYSGRSSIVQYAAIASRFADIGFRDQCFYHLWQGNLFDETVDWADLPTKLSHEGSNLIRLDLSPR